MMPDFVGFSAGFKFFVSSSKDGFVAPTDYAGLEAVTFVFLDITTWKNGTERINGLELFLKERDHLIESGKR